MNRAVIIAVLSLGLLAGIGIGYVSAGRGGRNAAGASAKVRETPETSPPEAGNVVSKTSDQQERRRAAQKRAVELEDGLRAALQKPSALGRDYALIRLFRSLGPEQFPAALAFLDRQGGPGSVVAKTHLFQCWADVAPEEAVRRALSEPDAGLRRKYAGAALKQWGRGDLKGATAFAEGLPPEELSDAMQFLERLAVRRSGGNVPPTEQLSQILAAQPDDSKRRAKVSELFAQWVRDDLKGAITQAQNIPEGAARAAAVSQVMDAWMRKEPDAAGRWLDGLELREKAEIQEGFEKYLAVTDPEGAKAYVLRQKSTGDGVGDARSRVIDTVFRELYERDPEGAIAFFDSLPDRSSQFHSEIWKLRLESDPARAMQDILNHPLWQAEHVPWDWTQTLKSTLEPLARKDPRAAAEFASKVPKGDREALFAAIAEHWSAKDPTDAIKWAVSLPAGSIQDAALREFTAGWAAHDTKEATEWLNQIPAGSARSAAAEGFARAIFDADPDGALEWLRQVPNVDDRIQSLGRAWGRWSEENGDVAMDWLENAPFDPRERAEFERAIANAFK
jgi:hypothetical protein